MEQENKNTFTRGEVVMVRDCDYQEWKEKIYLATIEGATHPYICVSEGWGEAFNEGKDFYIESWKQIKKKEETVTITLSKSDHEKVKSLLNECRDIITSMKTITK